jgi:hypothetical protein
MFGWVGSGCCQERTGSLGQRRAQLRAAQSASCKTVIRMRRHGWTINAVVSFYCRHALGFDLREGQVARRKSIEGSRVFKKRLLKEVPGVNPTETGSNWVSPPLREGGAGNSFFSVDGVR